MHLNIEVTREPEVQGREGLDEAFEEIITNRWLNSAIIKGTQWTPSEEQERKKQHPDTPQYLQISNQSKEEWALKAVQGERQGFREQRQELMQISG